VICHEVIVGHNSAEPGLEEVRVEEELCELMQFSKLQEATVGQGLDIETENLTPPGLGTEQWKAFFYMLNSQKNR